MLLSSQAPMGTITVHLDQPTRDISPTFFGLMTEEINHSYDGGLYAELVQNRALKDSPNGPVHWSLVGDNGSMSLETGEAIPNTALDHFLKLQVTNASGRPGVSNDGYWGIPVWANTSYRASFYAKVDGAINGVDVSIESNDGSQVFATGHVKDLGAGWHQFSLKLKTGKVQPTKDARLVLRPTNTGTLWLTQVSLFPPTFKNRPNGNRIDLMQKMIDLKPTFLRCPGGNYLEGNTIDERFDWKKTIGPIEQRPGHQGPWGYRSSDGLGLLEFMEWAEDLKAEPVLAVFASYALNGDRIASGPRLAGFVQDALDEIEYVTGDASTVWGARRIKDGHPKPFKLTYVEIGNEDWNGTQYEERFAAFYDAIRAKYPKLKLIATLNVHSRKPDLVDDHYYRKAKVMIKDAGHYDDADRKGHKIFVGEWASTDSTPWVSIPENATPTYNEALGDAAWLTGLERNADHVVMQCYAPLLTNINPKAAQWGVNLIGYDNLSSYASPSYYAQSMFAQFTGRVSVPVQIDANALAVADPATKGPIAVATWKTDAEYKDFKVTTPDGAVLLEKPIVSEDLSGFTLSGGKWEAHEGAIRQTQAEARGNSATIGDANWKDYTIHLKARKLGGEEGFNVQFHCQDEGHRWQWNVGGWSNTRSIFQHFDDGNFEEGKGANVTLETGRWYDLDLKISGDTFKGYLDGKLITERSAPAPSSAVAASASRTGDTLFLKIVNTAANDADLTISLAGIAKTAASAEGFELVGNPADRNSMADPLKVAPKAIKLTEVGPSFHHRFPGYSVTVLKLKVVK